MTAPATIGLAVLAVLTAGCGSDSGPASAEDDATAAASEPPPAEAATTEPAAEDVPWEALQDYLAAPRGSYTKVHGVDDNGQQATILEESTRFDLDAPFVQRELTIPVDALPPEQAAQAPDGLTFGFIQTQTALLMTSTDIEPVCGTPWVDMTSGALPPIPGLAEGDQALIVEPLDALGRAVGEPTHVETTADGSTYEVALPADAGFTMSATQRNDPAVIDTLAGMQTVAEVTLPPDGGALTVSVDFTEVMSALSGQPIPDGTVVRTVWTVTPDPEAFDTTLPEAADASCLAPPAEG